MKLIHDNECLTGMQSYRMVPKWETSNNANSEYVAHGMKYHVIPGTGNWFNKNSTVSANSSFFL